MASTEPQGLIETTDSSQPSPPDSFTPGSSKSPPLLRTATAAAVQLRAIRFDNGVDKPSARTHDYTAGTSGLIAILTTAVVSWRAAFDALPNLCICIRHLPTPGGHINNIPGLQSPVLAIFYSFCVSSIFHLIGVAHITLIESTHEYECLQGIPRGDSILFKCAFGCCGRLNCDAEIPESLLIGRILNDPYQQPPLSWSRATQIFLLFATTS